MSCGEPEPELVDAMLLEAIVVARGRGCTCGDDEMELSAYWEAGTQTVHVVVSHVACCPLYPPGGEIREVSL